MLAYKPIAGTITAALGRIPCRYANMLLTTRAAYGNFFYYNSQFYILPRTSRTVNNEVRNAIVLKCRTCGYFLYTNLGSFHAKKEKKNQNLPSTGGGEGGEAVLSRQRLPAAGQRALPEE